MNTTKQDLIVEVAKEIGCKKSLASQVVDCIFDSMLARLIEGDRIEIRGFGVFQVKDTNAKPGARNPRTGEPILVPARRKTQFKPGKTLRDGMRRPIRPARSASES